jgi:hypothetical protein
MHYCPECGQACYCSGDLDDCEVRLQSWVDRYCAHECEGFEDDEWDCPVCGCARCDCDEEDNDATPPLGVVPQPDATP